ncbi:MAG: segregation/condensation protein A [Desulfuromonadales bacterium]|nr:segregation/condensation protein A [Desulfuromonadales bacterium]
MGYEIRLEKFEGPLDLLLHLIRKNEMDVYDIPIAEITTQYLAILDAMQTLNLDVAGEFLLMAATLIHIKSRLLLPQATEDEGEDEDEDPRAELVRRLLEYQKYKEAALVLDRLPQLERDLFVRNFADPEPAPEESEEEFEAVGLYQLAEALRALLQEKPEAAAHEVNSERLSITDRINRILFLLTGRDSLGFAELVSASPDRHEVVVTFLAMLELVKMRLVRLMQNSRHGTIWLFPAVAEQPRGELGVEEESFGYG